MVQKRTLGIILAGGKSSRLYPATLAIVKQLVPVYDKPMVYYPLSTLLLAGVKDILIVTNPSELVMFQKLLGNGEEFGVQFNYVIQKEPKGIAQAIHLANNCFNDPEEFDSVFLILGDNIFHSGGLSGIFQSAIDNCRTWKRAHTFFQRVKDPQRFGVGEFDDIGILKSIEEKPVAPKSDWASVGAYIYPMTDNGSDVFRAAYNLSPSKRGEYEITDLNNLYLSTNQMNGHRFPRGTAWFDCGTYDSLHEASGYIQAIQNSQGVMVASPHEVAWYMENVTDQTIIDYIVKTGGDKKNAYNEYLKAMVDRGRN
jgi:glucose-1-phosphate thymidylyltransferase